MAKLYNRAKVSTSTTGTGTVTLGNETSDAFCTFAEAGVQNSDVVTYLIEKGDDFELGRGTYTSSGTALSRDTVLLSKIAGTSGTSKMDLGGAAVVSIVAAAEDIKGAASTSEAGIVELATDAEAIAKSSTTVALTPSNLAAMPVFSVHRNGSNQTISQATWTKVQLTTEVADVGSYFDSSTNYRWTPPAGNVQIIGRLQYTTNIQATSRAYISIYKNGSSYKAFSTYAGEAGLADVMVVFLDAADGDDYYEMWTYVTNVSGGVSATLHGDASVTFFMGYIL